MTLPFDEHIRGTVVAVAAAAASPVDRFATPLYTVAEAARYLDVPATTFSAWAAGYTRRLPGRPVTSGAPILTAVPAATSGDPSVPFIGLAEGVVLSALRRAGVPLQRIRPALSRLQQELGLPYVLASRRLYTDGAEVLFDYADHSGDAGAARAVRDLTVVRSGQRQFAGVVDRYLRRVDFGPDGYAVTLRLPAYEAAEILVDPARGLGQPVFARGGARLEDALSLFRAGESVDTVAAEYGMPREHLEDALRLATRVAA